MWVEFLYASVPHFFAASGDSSGVAVHSFIRSTDAHSLTVERKRIDVLRIDMETMGLDIAHIFLRAMLFNQRAFAMRLSSKFNTPYCLMTRPKITRKKEKVENRQYWIQNLCCGKNDSVVIRLEPGYMPWVEKRADIGNELKALYKESTKPEWCVNVIKALTSEDETRVGKYGKEYVVDSTANHTLLWLEPVGVHPMVTVETADDVKRMARDILKALKFLHGKGWVHCDARYCNIIRTPTGIFVLIDLENAQKLDKSGTAPVPPNLRPSLQTEASMTEEPPSRWRPFYDLSLFLGTALTTATEILAERIRAHEYLGKLADDAPPNSIPGETLNAPLLKKDLLGVLQEWDKRFAKFQNTLCQEDGALANAGKEPLTAKDVVYASGDGLSFTLELVPGKAQAKAKAAPKKCATKRSRMHEDLNLPSKLNKTDTATSKDEEVRVSQAHKSDKATSSVRRVDAGGKKAKKSTGKQKSSDLLRLGGA